MSSFGDIINFVDIGTERIFVFKNSEIAWVFCRYWKIRRYLAGNSQTFCLQNSLSFSSNLNFLVCVLLCRRIGKWVRFPFLTNFFKKLKICGRRILALPDRILIFLCKMWVDLDSNNTVFISLLMMKIKKLYFCSN